MSDRCSAIRARYFHVDLPVVSAAITLLRSFMPRKSIDELYTVLGRAKQGKTERYFALQRHLDKSIDSFVHAPGERGLVMIVFTLPSHDLVFKVIRDQFGAPKTSTRDDVIERYQFVFRHDRAGRLVDAQEFKRLRLPRARFMPDLADELLSEASESCRIEGEDLIVEHCYIERRLRPLNLFLREADPAAAESAIIDYGNALRDLAASNVFPGDLLLKNFGVTSHGRVIFYDYDEICLVSDCVFRDLPSRAARMRNTAASPGFIADRATCSPNSGCPFFPYRRRCAPVFKQPPCGAADGGLVARSVGGMPPRRFGRLIRAGRRRIAHGIEQRGGVGQPRGARANVLNIRVLDTAAPPSGSRRIPSHPAGTATRCHAAWQCAAFAARSAWASVLASSSSDTRVSATFWNAASTVCLYCATAAS